MGYVGSMVFGYPVNAGVAETMEEDDEEILKELEKKNIYIHKYGEESHSFCYDEQESYIFGVDLNEETTQRVIERNRRLLKSHEGLQALLDKYKIDRKLLIRSYGYHS